jgi:hypothetical protein
LDWYDTNRETGYTTNTLNALTQTANIHVPSMYPHEIFQGDILEGFIIRYISGDRHQNDVVMTSMHRLAKTAQEILQVVLPTLPPSFFLVADSTNDMEDEDNNGTLSRQPPISKVLSVDIRKILDVILFPSDDGGVATAAIDNSTGSSSMTLQEQRHRRNLLSP